ncbi:unnamed protein product, partial [Dibothriocephalus latus]
MLMSWSTTFAIVIPIWWMAVRLSVLAAPPWSPPWSPMSSCRLTCED